MKRNNILVIRRKVKYPRLELKTELPVLIMPQNSQLDPGSVIEKHQSWLKKKIEFIKMIKKKYKNQPIFERRESELIKLVVRYVSEYTKILGEKPSKISFRYLKSRWGSCSKKGRITFNLMLKYLPPRLIRYLVFHEMAHLLVPYHNKKFWVLIEQKFKKPSQNEEKLFAYWFLLNRKNNFKNSLNQS